MNTRSKSVIYKRMKTTILTICLFTASIVSGQTDWITDVDQSKIVDWDADQPNYYQAGYHFGDSEWESKLILIYYQDHWYAQLNTGTWSNDGRNWINNFENFKDVRIRGNNFYSNKSNGKFVMFISEDDTLFGLKIFNSWSGEDGPEIGARIYSLRDNFQGKYPQASYRELNISELQKLNKSELRIMRNEIFARYGYIFESGGQMDGYFRKQNWYSPQHKDVTNFLTKIEKDNIKLIQSIERE